MSSINDVIATDFKRILAGDAVAVHNVTYTPKGGEPETVRAQIRLREGVGEFGRPDGRVFRAEIEIDVMESECPALAVGDSFTYDGEEYKVDRSPRVLGPLRTVIGILVTGRFKGKDSRLLPTGN